MLIPCLTIVSPFQKESTVFSKAAEKISELKICDKMSKNLFAVFPKTAEKIKTGNKIFELTF